MRQLVAALPRPTGLEGEAFAARHRGILAALWACAAGLGLYALLGTGVGLWHSVLDVAPVVAFTLLAARGPWSPAVRAALASAGLVTAAAVLTHLAGGAIAAHFSFFVALPVVGLYHDWRPFAVAVVYVVVHHAGFALLHPASVYDTPGSSLEILGRTGVHAAFVVIEVIALVLSWKLAETQAEELAQERERLVEQAEQLQAAARQAQDEVAAREGTLAELREISAEVQEGARTLAGGAEEIVSRVQTTAAEAQQQAAAIQEAGAVVERVRAATTDAAQEAERVAREARAAQDATARGTAAVGRLVHEMVSAGDHVATIAQDVENLTTRLHGVAEIAATVGKLAGHANLLALNASIEAARAGEHGRGFAVVAGEVRAFSEQSKAATQMIADRVEELEQAGRAAVAAAMEGREVVERGAGIADDAGQAIETLAGVIRAAAEDVEHIAATVSRQDEEMRAVAGTMTEVAGATEAGARNAAGAEDVAVRLLTLSGDLERLVARQRV